MRQSKSRANEARYDKETDIYVGPSSKVLRVDEIAESPFLSQAPAAPDYVHDHSAASLRRLAEACSIEDVASETRQLLNDKELVQSMRRRLLDWAESVDEESGPSQVGSARKSKRIKVIPNKDSALRLTEEDKLKDIDGKVPHAYNIFAHPEYANLYYKRDGLLEQNHLHRSATSSMPTQEVSKPLLDLDERVHSVSDSTYSNNKTVCNPLVLTISVYSRHARGLWAKEKVKQVLERSNLSGSEEQDDVSEEVLGSQEGGEFNGGKAERGLYGNLQLSQELDLLSIHTLQDLREMISCKMDAMPGMQRREQDSSGMPQFTSQRRITDSCIQIEDQIYSEKESLTSYAHQIADHINQYTASKQPQGEVSIGSIPLCTGKLYWYLHQGNCEHMWCITSVRALRDEEERESLQRPRTIYCSYGNSISPLARYSRPKMPVMKQVQLDKCDFCRKRQGKKVIIGGSRVNIAATGIDGLKQEHVISCEACYTALMGANATADGTSVTTSGRWTVVSSLD